MGLGAEIGFTLGILTQNINLLLEQAGALPDPADVQRAEGASTEPAQSAMRERLRIIARGIAQNTETVRALVETNSTAFQQAAAMHVENEDAGSLQSRQEDAFVEGILAAPAPAAPTPPPTPAPGTGGAPTAW
ncbi:hypothetical protein AB0N73_13685 [Microbacterium sp. NPDC089189]|uniref:hypothetical protein n=1 Tax=Microbacterium sp. NPDC089189 TaxID=3154972 RepID=UPI003449CBC3